MTWRWQLDKLEAYLRTWDPQRKLERIYATYPNIYYAAGKPPTRQLDNGELYRVII